MILDIKLVTQPQERLLHIRLDALHAHPANANLMSEEHLVKLIRNIDREGNYPPLVARPHPDIEGEFQLLDGVQRKGALERLGADSALCYLWPCDDSTAHVLLVTLNRLRGEDVPVLRAAVLKQLNDLLPLEVVESLLPESPKEIERTLALVAVDGNALLAELSAATQRSEEKPRAVSFAVSPEELALVEEAVNLAMASLEGRNRRGRALASICHAYLEAARA